MSLGTAIVSGIALKAIHDALSDTEASHNDVLEEAYESVAGEVSQSTNVFVDHINDRRGVNADGTPHSEVPNTERVPDLVVSGFSDRNLVVEVETASTIDQTAVEQLDDFSTPGYTRVLVVPEQAVDDGHQLVSDNLDGDVYVSGADSVSNFL
jgi:hypothetical protein